MSKIIGQDKLIKEVNRIFQVFINSNCEIRPHFILTDESGSGKSFTIKQLCGMNELLESDTTSVFGDYGKYISVPIDNVLFVFAGAFNNEPHIRQTKGLKQSFLEE